VQSHPSGSPRTGITTRYEALVLLLLNFSFLLLTFRLASISALKFEAIKKKGKIQKRGQSGGRHNWRENYELIRRSESGDRGRDQLGRVDRGRHDPGVAKAAAIHDATPRNNYLSGGMPRTEALN